MSTSRCDYWATRELEAFSFLYLYGGGCTVAELPLARQCINFLRSHGIQVKEYRGNEGLETFLKIMVDAGI